MAKAKDLWDLEALCPWDRPEFRSGLASLVGSAELAARQYAADARVLAELVSMVPRCAFDERGATPWTSFRREVAVARKVTDQAAATLIRSAVSLISHLPVVLGLLEAGTVTVERASSFVRELEPCGDELAGRVDASIAVRIAGLPVWRIAQEVRRAVQLLDPEAGAQRVSLKNASRGVSLLPDADDQALVSIFGPAVPLARWHATLDAQARALKQAGDPRGLDALRFDLATSTYPCTAHTPADPTTAADPVTPADPTTSANSAQPAARAPADAGAGAAGPGGLRPSFVEPASGDCRRSRPVQASIVVPVETALGLSSEPGWLAGYGFLSAPTCRLLLVDAELRRVCAQAGTGQLLDVTDRTVRPVPSPTGVRAALLDLVLDDATLTGIADQVEPGHDPSVSLREFVLLRDRGDDGPTGTRTPAVGCHLDHTVPYPHGPTAAWNLAVRGRRTHQLKHYGWIPLRTPTTTIWTSPAGQLVEVPRHTTPPPGVDPDPHGQGHRQASLPDPDELDLLDRAQLEAPTDDHPPWLPDSERDTTTWTWFTGPDDIAC